MRSTLSTFTKHTMGRVRRRTSTKQRRSRRWCAVSARDAGGTQKTTATPASRVPSFAPSARTLAANAPGTCETPVPPGRGELGVRRQQYEELAIKGRPRYVKCTISISIDYADGFGHFRANLPHPLGAQAALVPHHVRHRLGRGLFAAAGRSRRRFPLGKQA